MNIKFIEALENALNKPLPGVQSQLKMASSAFADKYLTLPETYKTACVLILLFPKNNEWHLVLMERAQRDEKDKHSGQISFPGGKLEPGDRTYEECALRETFEEIGVLPGSIGLLGSLSPLYVHVSNFLVHPFIGFTSEYPRFSLHPEEVSAIVEVPVMHFIHDNHKVQVDIPIRDMILPAIPAYTLENKYLWGATAMMMSEFEDVLKNIGQGENIW